MRALNLFVPLGLGRYQEDNQVVWLSPRLKLLVVWVGPLDLLFCTGKAQLFSHRVFNQWLIRLSRLPSLIEPIECLGCWAIKPLHSAVAGTRLSAQMNVERREVKFHHFSKKLSMGGVYIMTPVRVLLCSALAVDVTSSWLSYSAGKNWFYIVRPQRLDI